MQHMTRKLNEIQRTQGNKRGPGRIPADMLAYDWPRIDHEEKDGLIVNTLMRPPHPNIWTRFVVAFDVLIGRADGVYWYRQ